MSWVKDDYWPSGEDAVTTSHSDPIAQPPQHSNQSASSSSSPASLLNLQHFIEPSCRAILGTIDEHLIQRFFSSPPSSASRVERACATFADSVCTITDTALDIVVFPLRGMPDPARRLLFYPSSVSPEDDGEGMTWTVPDPAEEERKCFIAFCLALGLLLLALLIHFRFRKYVRLLAR